MDSGGKMHVWRVDTNPVIVQSPQSYLMEPNSFRLRMEFVERITDSLEKIDEPLDSENIPIDWASAAHRISSANL